jgi:hypothetical protein
MKQSGFALRFPWKNWTSGIPSRHASRLDRQRLVPSLPAVLSYRLEIRAMSPLLGMFGIGTTEMMIFALIVLLLFGNRLPGVMRSMGRGIV